MSDTLTKICAHKRKHIDLCIETVSLAEIEKKAMHGPQVRKFADKLLRTIKKGETGLIAEIKKASPSKGLIRKNFDPSGLSQAYENGGAACLSVLTDIPYFMGHNDHLINARVASELPVLRKDFILDPYQVFEARAIGSDCILLIMAVLTDETAKNLSVLAHELGMDVLIEVHNKEELQRAADIDSRLLGINNRNLKTLEVNITTVEQLAPQAPLEKIIVAESGLNTHADIDRMARVGAHCILVGESLMRQQDVKKATKRLLQGDYPFKVSI